METKSAIEVARAHGFSLQSVCWGYRALFATALQDLVDAGSIGARNPGATRRVFEMLGAAERSCYDHVLKEFLTALNPANRWLLNLPGVFGGVVDMGRRLGEQRVHFGTSFFELLGQGRLGRTPKEMRACITVCHRLFEEDPEYALAFARGFARLRDRLNEHGIDLFVGHGRRLPIRDRSMLLDYYSCDSRAAENVIRSLTQECRLEDVTHRLSALLRALVGHDVELDDLGRLDADDLIERGTTFVCMPKWCYVPITVRAFDSVAANRDWYRLLTVVAAAMLDGRSFPVVHGEPGCRSIVDLVGGLVLESVARANLVVIAEYARIVGRIRSSWPGARGLLDLGIRVDFDDPDTPDPAERVLREVFDELARDRAVDESAHRQIRSIAESSVNVFDTVRLVTDDLAARYPELGRRPMRALRFLPDFFFSAEIASAANESMVADLRSQADLAHRRREGDESAASARALARDGEAVVGDEDEHHALEAAFLYDEWDHARGEYHENYCRLHETVPQEGDGRTLSAQIAGQARRVRRIFESMKPELARTERYLEDGVEINSDLLYDYVIDTYHEPSPRVRFYERPRLVRRDLAVLILLDASGSTSGTHGTATIIDLEKQATAILAEALDSLGDRFEIGGFSTRGPENCDYLVFKALDDRWDETVLGRLDRAHPANSTRMGVALRHAGYRLAAVEARQKLILVITDGRPMDDHYSPDTRYAQFDVRMACEENRKLDIHTFAISTEENSFTDMEIMFPRRRFAILRDMRDLPVVLPRLYVRLTV